MAWWFDSTIITDPDLKINRDILWATVVFGALALIFSLISISVTFWLSYRERHEHFRQSIIANIEYLLKNLKVSFDDIGQSIFYKNNLGLKRSIDSFDIYATLTLDELNPKVFSSGHNRIEFSVYRKVMEDMMKNSLPLAVDRYNAVLSMSKNRLKLPETKKDKITTHRLTEYLKTFSQKLEKKQTLMANLKRHPKLAWSYTEKELTEFRLMLETIWAHLLEGYKQHQNDLTKNKDSGWKAMDKIFSDQENTFHQFRGTLQSLFLT